MSIPRPTFVRIEYHNQHGWWTGHAGMNLMDPRAYVEGCVANGRMTRAVVVDTGEIIEPEGADLL